MNGIYLEDLTNVGRIIECMFHHFPWWQMSLAINKKQLSEYRRILSGISSIALKLHFLFVLLSASNFLLWSDRAGKSEGIALISVLH